MLPATTTSAAMYVAVLAIMLAVAPVEAQRCVSSDILPAGASFSSPALVVLLSKAVTRAPAAVSQECDSKTVTAACVKLKQYHRHRSEMEEGQLDAVVAAIETSTSITQVSLGNCKIGEAGAASLAEPLKTNAFITSVNLYGNAIGDSGAIALAAVLLLDTPLVELKVEENSIGATGTSALMKVGSTRPLGVSPL